MNLPADVTRCTGNERDNHQPCPLRQTCARYRDYFATHLPASQPVPRMYAPKICNGLYIEYIESEE